MRPAGRSHDFRSVSRPAPGLAGDRWMHRGRWWSRSLDGTSDVSSAGVKRSPCFGASRRVQTEPAEKCRRGRRCAFPHHPPFVKPRSLGFSESEGRSSGSDGCDPAGPRSALVGGGVSPERLAEIRRAPECRFHRQLPPPTADPRACGAQDRGPGLPPPHGRPRRPVSRAATDPSIDSSRPKLAPLRPTDDAEAADVDGSDGCHYERVSVATAPSRSACPSERWIRPPPVVIKPGGGAPRCCAAWAAWRSRPPSSGCFRRCTWPGCSPA